MQFVKYHGTGNDFILIDDRARQFPAQDYAYVAALCHRRFGIGADGLILLQPAAEPGQQFHMAYYNADGRPSTFCGNGGRCTVAFAASLGLVAPGAEVRFTAADGLHTAVYHSTERVELAMRPAASPKPVTLADGQAGFFIDTGSPHLILPVSAVAEVEVVALGRTYRHDPLFASIGGANVNFVERLSTSHLHVRTYERGVEDETLSCGTGVTAAALWAAPSHTVRVDTPGGTLSVTSTADLSQVTLSGPAQQVFTGTL